MSQDGAKVAMVSLPHSGVESHDAGDIVPVQVRTNRGANVQINIPGGGGQHAAASADNAVDIVVYFANNVGLQLSVCDGQNVSASELFEMVMEEVPEGHSKYPPEARELFSLWLVSDLLELQLKPNHVPFKLVCYWEELLEKYSLASEFNRQRDEPMIMFKRNVFCSITTEKQILQNESPGVSEMVRLLYHEARKNVLTGRYPVDQQKCDDLAGLHAVVTFMERQSKHLETSDMETEDYFRLNVAEYLPAHFAKRNWVFNKNSNPECRLLASFHNKRDEYRSVQDVTIIYRRYLEICQELQYYGSAFFRGQVEHPGRRLLSSRVDDPVYVAINTEGVYVIDEDDFVLLIGLPYKFLCWQRAESSSQPADRCLPCLFLQFPVSAVPGKESSRETQLFQIFSQEAILMDKLIEVCVELKKNDKSDAGRTDLHIIKGRGEIAQQFERLALITFDDKHKPIGKASVRKPRTGTGSARQASARP